MLWWLLIEESVTANSTWEGKTDFLTHGKALKTEMIIRIFVINPVAITKLF
jgi:hypothetical protein